MRPRATSDGLDKASPKPRRGPKGTYGVPVISHQCLETHGLVAEWDADGGLDRLGLDAGDRFAPPRHWPGGSASRPTKVKCITHYMGGGFGSKFGPDVQGFAAADLARRAGAAVKIMLDREEEVITAGNRPSAYGTVKIGGNKDGTHHRLRDRLLRHVRVTPAGPRSTSDLLAVHLSATRSRT